VSVARTLADDRRLEEVEVLIDGPGRAPARVSRATRRCFVTGADAFRFYDNDLDGVEHDFTAEPDHPPQLQRPRDPASTRDGSIPKDNPWLRPRDRAA